MRSSRKSSFQFSVYWRIGDEPMKTHVSIGMPLFSAQRRIGSIS